MLSIIKLINVMIQNANCSILTLNLGKYMIKGSIRRRCIGGKWDGLQPKCIGLNQHYDYSPSMPPTILFRHKSGQIAQSNDGKLVVEPGTTLHMECLYKRRNGTPTWDIMNYSKRTYPQVRITIINILTTHNYIDI